MAFLQSCWHNIGYGGNGKIEAGQLTGARGKRAVIIGGSMSGLFAGSCCARPGWTSTSIERVESELSGRGAGIVAQPN